MKKITVAIVDDHRLIREMWAELFTVNNEFKLTGEGGTLNEGVEMIKALCRNGVFQRRPRRFHLLT